MTALKTLVLGASGFIGQALVAKLLEQGHPVLAVDDPLSAIDLPHQAGVSHVKLDRLDRSQLLQHLSGCDCVVNLAPLHPGTLQAQFRFAIASTQTLLQACAEAQVKKLIHISSTAVYGDPPAGVITEESPCLASLKPQTSIQQAVEHQVLQVEVGNTEVVILQLGRVYGPGAGGETARTLSQMKTAFMPIVRQGIGYCNPIYIEDVVAAIIRACEVLDLHKQRFIISQDQPVCWRELLSGYESILAAKSLIHLPIDYLCEPQDSIPFFREALSKVLRKRKVMEGTSAIAQKIYGKSIYYPSADEFRALVAQPIFSNQKSRDRLNFQPQISLQTGIEKIREWWSQLPLEMV
jgi:nucleoside-diphosphate-sugar epimerase